MCDACHGHQPPTVRELVRIFILGISEAREGINLPFDAPQDSTRAHVYEAGRAIGLAWSGKPATDTEGEINR